MGEGERGVNEDKNREREKERGVERDRVGCWESVRYGRGEIE